MNTSEKLPKWAFPAAVALIAGNLIGAGILAMPASLGLGGMVPSLVIMVIYGAMMLFSAEVLLREAAAAPGVNYNLTTLYQSYLGNFGKWLAVAANLLVLYGLMTAYITGGTKVLGSLLGISGSPPYLVLMLAAVPVALAVIKLSVIQKYNIFLILIMMSAFAVMVVIGETKAELSRLAHMSWSHVPGAIPLVVTAFYFHNIIPVVSAGLNWNEKMIRRAAISGIFIAFAMCSIWLQTGICALPFEGENSIVSTYKAAEPATIPMSRIIGSKTFVIAATTFSLMTVVTAFIGSGIALQGFLRGLLPRTSQLLIRLAALAPPVLVSMIWPDLFLKAVDVVGGIGIVTLFGVLPALVAICKRTNSRRFRIAGCFFLVLALAALTIEIAQEFGLTKMHPDAEVEYWKHNSHKLLEINK